MLSQPFLLQLKMAEKDNITVDNENSVMYTYIYNDAPAVIARRQDIFRFSIYSDIRRVII